ncbi:MAG: alpha/beta fold hydrolase [Planctomycetota bacterium]
MATRSATRRRRWQRLASVFATLVLAGALIAFAALPSCVRPMVAPAIVHVTNTDRTIDPARDPDPAELRRLGIDQQFRVDVPGDHPASLSVWVIEPPQPPTATLLILHGINDAKSNMRTLGQAFADEGFRVVLADLRAHGRSTGRYATFGVRDATDLQALLNDLDQRALLTDQLAVLGPSYGGAAAAQLAALDPRVDRLILVATFSSMRAIVPRYVRRYSPLGIGHLLDEADIQAAIDDAGSRAAFDPDAADSAAALAADDVPTLIFHGSADTHIPPAHARALDDAAPNSRLILLDGATHHTVFAAPHFDTVFAESLTFLRDPAPTANPSDRP